MFSWLSEIIAPLPNDESVRSALKQKREEVAIQRQQLTELGGHSAVARHALGFGRRQAPQPFKIHEESGVGGGRRNLTINPDSPHQERRALPRTLSPSPVSNPGFSTPSISPRPGSAGMYSPQTPLSPFITATEVPESVIKLAGEAGYMTAVYANDVNKLHLHHASFFSYCRGSKKKHDEYLALLEENLDMDPDLVSARSSDDRYYSMTGLHIAAKENSVAMCKLLLRRRADAKAVDVRGRTPLHLAAKYLRPEVCAMLYDEMKKMDEVPPVGASAPVDLRGWTPAMYAHYATTKKEEEAKAKEKIRSMLYAHGDPHISPRNGAALRLGRTTLQYTTTTPSEDRLKFGHQWMKGWRPTFEDTYVAKYLPDVQSISVFGIFDGHGGVYTSRFVAENIAKDFNAKFVTEMLASSRTERDLCEDPKLLCKLLERVFFGLDAKLRKNPMLSGECKGVVEARKKRIEDGHGTGGQSQKRFNAEMSTFGATKAADNSGSTGVFVVITPTYIITANVGDSRAVICTSSGVASGLTNDHTPKVASESERIRRAGGFVGQNHRVYAREKDMERDMASIAVTRSFGDFSYKNCRDPLTGALLPSMNQLLLCLPEISIRKRRTDDHFLLLACDGIWDVMDRERACKCLKDTLDKNSVNGCFEGNIDDCLYDLLIECMKLETTDNLSAVAVLFDEVSQRCVEFHPHQGGEAIHWYKSEYLAEDGITVKTPVPTLAGGASAELQSRLESRPNYEKEGITIANDASEAGRTRDVTETSGADAELASVLQRVRLRNGIADPPTVTHPAPVAMEAIETFPASPSAPVNASLESIDLDER